MTWLLEAARLALRGGAFARPVWLFWLDFTVYPVVLTALIARDRATLIAFDRGALAWIALAISGFLLFTLVEYWAHRVPLHLMFYHGAHERHHTHPAEYTVFPIYTTPPIFIGAWMVLPAAIFAGFVAGYCWFLVWHHTLHHFDLNRLPRLVRRYAVWHLAHHHDPACNFGITLPLWDYLFGTFRRAPAS
jgi:dihydroceramide fatty acyl 2-hydroxylase